MLSIECPSDIFIIINLRKKNERIQLDAKWVQKLKIALEIIFINNQLGLRPNLSGVNGKLTYTVMFLMHFVLRYCCLRNRQMRRTLC